MEENYPSERHYALSDAIDAKDWAEAESLILAGVEEHRDYYDYDDYPMVFELIEAGQEDLAILWLENGYPSWITGGKEEATILHWAAKYGMTRLTRKLLDLGLDINELTQPSYSALWYAAKYGQLESAEFLIANGAYVDGEKIREDFIPQTDTPLCVAANAEIAKLLLESGASVEIGPCAGSFFWGDEFDSLCAYDETLSPLTVAAIHGCMDVVRLLADWGLPVDSQALRFLAFDKYGATFDDAVELVRMGADPNGKPGEEPLRVAARMGNSQFCRFLLENGAKPLSELLSLAVLSGDQECVELFLKVGDPASAIRLAAERGAGSILDELLNFRPDLSGHALLGAIAGCRLSLAREMLARGADPNFRDADGNTPLITLYAIDRRIGTFRFMINNPSRYPAEWKYSTPKRLRDINFERDDAWHFFIHRPDNWNEIMERIETDVMELASELIDKGADIHAKDNKGRSVLWYACAMSWLKSIPWLAGMGLNINNRDKDGNSAFVAGCLCGESLTIRPMVEAGAVIDDRDGNGDTALIKVGQRWIQNPHGFSLTAVMTLLEFGADPDVENNSGISLRKLAEKDESLKRSINYAEKE